MRDPIEALYREHSEALFRLAFRICGDAADAEDVLHDVFVALPNTLPTFRGSGKLAVWLRKVTVRAALGRMRRAKRRKESPPPEAWPGAADPQLNEIPTRHALIQAIEALPRKLRVVFLLREVEGYTHAEIGEMLGVRPGTSEVRLHRAKRQLRLALYEDR